MPLFQDYILRTYGDQGAQWLEDLPHLIKSISITYNLSHLAAFQNSSYHYLLSGYQDARPIILKIGLDYEDMNRETIALEIFKGNGVVELLASKPGILLLERVIPGTTLASYFLKQEEESIHIAFSLMKHLYQTPLPSSILFPSLGDWFKNLDKEWPIPSFYLEKARTLKNELLSTSRPHRLLHGDFHHQNIVQGDHGWVAIDPKGVIGDPLYDAAVFIRNPLHLALESNAKDLIQNRITLMSSLLKENPRDLRDWCFMQTVLAWSWALEDQMPTDSFEKTIILFEN